MPSSQAVSRHQDLAVFRLACNLAVRVHTMRLCRPHSETHDGAQALRRGARRVVEAVAAVGERPLGRHQVVDGLLAAQGACGEMRVQLDLLWSTGGLDDAQFSTLHDGYQQLECLLAQLAGLARLRGQAALWVSARDADGASAGDGSPVS